MSFWTYDGYWDFVRGLRRHINHRLEFMDLSLVIQEYVAPAKWMAHVRFEHSPKRHVTQLRLAPFHVYCCRDVSKLTLYYEPPFGMWHHLQYPDACYALVVHKLQLRISVDCGQHMLQVEKCDRGVFTPDELVFISQAFTV